MKFLIFLLFFSITSVFFTTRAHAEFLIEFDCYFVTGPVGCQELENSFFSNTPKKTVHASSWVAQARGKDTPNLTISLRSFELDRNYRYEMKFIGGTDLPSFTLHEFKVLKSFSSSAALILLLGDMQKGLAPFFQVENPGEVKDGYLTLKLKNPGKGEVEKPQDETTGWFTNLGAYGNFSYGTSTSFSVNGSVNLNYSDPKMRFITSADATYSKVILKLSDGTTEEQEMASFNGTILVARSVTDQWSVAMAFSPKHNPDGGNIDFQGRLSLGVEWDLVPFLNSNDKSFGVRYAISPMYQNYTKPNIQNKEQQAFVAHSLGAYLTWHFKPVDVTTYLEMNSKIDDYNFFEIYHGVNLGFRITQYLNLGLNGNIGYRNKLINEPKNIDADATEQLFSGYNYSAWTVSSGLNLNFIIGNSSLNRSDMRWSQ